MMTLTNHFCCLLLLFICLTSFLQTVGTADIENACKVLNGEPLSFYSCGTDCSQQDANGFLNCSICEKEEVEKFSFSDEPPIAPPDLIDIKYVYGLIQVAQGKGDYLGSIYIQFRLPRVVRRIFPNAVRLFFQGLSKDDYYNACPRHRIFIFHNYNSESMKESVHPRIISYNCFHGVQYEPINVDDNNRTESKKGYLLGLKSNPGQWINYTLTIDRRSALQKEHWIPAIAVSLEMNNHALNVLVEKEPAGVKLENATADLEMVNNTKPWPSEELVEQKCTFHGLVHGHYIVKVVIHGILNGKVQKWTGESVAINATGIPNDEYPIHYADTSGKLLKIFSVAAGCLIWLVLLVLLCCVVYQQRICQKVLTLGRTAKGFILHPYDNEPNSITLEFITKFGRLLENECACSLLSRKSIKSKSRVEVKNWLEDEFRSLTFIIVFYNSFCYDVEDINANSYSCILNEAVKRKELHIIPICLTHSHSLPSVIAKETVVKWDDLENLYCHIHGHVVPLERKDSLSGKWKITNTGKDLLELFRRLSVQMRLGNAGDDQNQDYDIEEDRLNVRQPVNDDDFASKPPEPQAIEDMKNFAMSLNIESDRKMKESQGKECKRKTTLYNVQADIHRVHSGESDIKPRNQHLSPDVVKQAADPIAHKSHKWLREIEGNISSNDGLSPQKQKFSSSRDDTMHHLHPRQQYPCRSDWYHTAGHQQHMIPCESAVHPVDSFRPAYPLGFCDHTSLPDLEMNYQIPDDSDISFPDETYPMIQKENESQADYWGNQRYRPPTCEHQNLHDQPRRPICGMHLPPDQYAFPDKDMDAIQRLKTCRRENLSLRMHFQSRADLPDRSILPYDGECANSNGFNAHKLLSNFYNESRPLLHVGEKPVHGSDELCHRTVFNAMCKPPFETDTQTWSRSRATQGRLHKPHYKRKVNGNRIDNIRMSGPRIDLDSLDLLPDTRRSEGCFQNEPDSVREDLDQSWDDVNISVSQTDLSEDD